MIKVCTTKISGKNVRSFLFLVFAVFALLSCEIQDENVNDDARDNIVGTWKCQEKDKTNTAINFEAVISKNSSDTTKIWVDNFSSLGQGINVSVGMDGYLLTIARQTVDGNIIQGSASISSSYETINWTYSIDDGAGKENYTAVYTR